LGESAANSSSCANEQELLFYRLFPFFFLHDYYMEPIRLINNRVIRNKFLRPSKKVAENAIKRLHKATKWAQASIAAAQKRQKRYTNRNRNPAFIYKLGDIIWLDLRNIRIFRISKKLDWTYGRYKIVKKISLHAYELNVPGKIHLMFHVNLFKPHPANFRFSQVQCHGEDQVGTEAKLTVITVVM
jgi:hypothetical protein